MYIVDKVENNPSKINGHPAWAAGECLLSYGAHIVGGTKFSEYSISKNSGRAMDVVTNSFCAGGTALGNGTWLNVGGNQAVGPGGVQAVSQLGGGVYDDPDGGKSYVRPTVSLQYGYDG